MKFWQKAFIGILVVFIIALNICLYLTSKYSFALNVKRDTYRALGEYHFIVNGIYEAMNSISSRDESGPAQTSVERLMRPYSDYYRKQNVFLELRHSKEPVFSNIPAAYASGIDSEAVSGNSYKIKVLSNGGKNYLYITGKLGGQYGDYTLTYVRDLAELYNFHAMLTRYLITVSASVETVLTLVLLFLLRRLTNPIRLLQKAAGKISGGVYSERISIPGRDEFHDLAENFNQMAANIQGKIGELDKNIQDKQRLVDNLAHELRTPLTAIRGYAEYLQGANTSEQNRIKASSYIISETDRMKSLAFKLLDLALIHNSKLDIQTVNPLELFHQAELSLRAKLREKDIRLDISSSLEQLQGDPVLLQSLLVNLADNAVKASPRGSSIQLSAYLDNGPVLEVKDWGCGMDEEQTDLVCEPFYRVDKARSRSSGGVGLGLTLCSEIAQLHGARLKIISQPGKGTAIQVIFTNCLQPPENSVTSGKL